MDWSLLHSLNGFLYRHDGVEDPLLTFIEASEALFAGMLVLVFIAAHGARNASWRRAAVAAALSAGLALAIGKVISELVDRARPFVADPGAVHLFTHHSPDPSFPSDHATAAFAIAVAILLRKRAWGVIALAAATVLAIGRVAIGVHYPSDVLAGAALGAAAALLLWAPPLRRRIDWLSDLLGRPVDRALGWTAARIGLARRA
ncbi:MAG TPA: phosphatase PAP2 family protein [Solirubrobacterales bacterium]|nr:phosphatase PAP2 family protein [Solirubrobacterales bacterium]